MGVFVFKRIAILSTVIAIGLVAFTVAGKAEQTAASRPAATSKPASRPASPKLSDKLVIIETSQGDITLELTPDKTPITVNNFLKYADDKFYDNLIFHRVIKGFMIQGGGYDAEAKRPDEDKKTRSPIKNESKSGLSNERGTISMARKADPDSATAQFFINLVPNKRLDTYGGGYTAFGKVVKGMDVVDKIADVPVKPGLSEAQPVEPVFIKSIHRAPAE